ncbi:hypothetical protein AGMMS49944_04030 [Spirochaetia bacterium]|nr:hypothetical protein AGMMS49944_04030 [Spirochaetia bacterium]
MKIPKLLRESSRNQKCREEWPMVLAYKLMNLDACGQDGKAIIDVRVFWADGSSKAKAVIWIYDQMGNRYGWGVGITDGFGYHHESEAIQDAFRDMGFVFESGEHFGSVGEGAQEKAIREIAREMGYENTLLVKFTP